MNERVKNGRVINLNLNIIKNPFDKMLIKVEEYFYETHK